MKKINNKILVITLLGLVAIFVLAKVFRSPKLESNLRKDLVAVDTASITEIRILPSSARDKPIKLVRNGKTWSASMDNKNFGADGLSVKRILEMFVGLDADRMVSRKKEKWETFNVGEKSTNIMLFQADNQVANIHIGKSGFNQSSQGNFGGGGYTYVRLSDEDEVYSVTGFYESVLNRSFNDWRDKTFIRFSKDLVTKVSFTYPADSSFVLEKRDSVWLANNRVVSKEKVMSYLGQFETKNVNSFADEFNPPATTAASVKFEGASGVLATIEGWRNENEWIFRSSLQENVFFSASGSGIEKELLVGPNYFR